ncbi:MAG: M23 family metallopeptidase [Alistipes sp.]|nr:M23 family metallopeptidase [Alistipes sp.]
MSIMKHISALLLAIMVVGCGGLFSEKKSENIAHEEVVEPTYLYGINVDGYEIVNDTVRMGETVGGILGRRGISPVTVDRLDKESKEIFPLRKIRADNAYTTFTRSYTDSLGEHSVLDYIVYHKNNIDYVVFGFVGDSISITLGSRPVELVRKRCEASITSSLWGTIMEQNLPYALAAEFEDIYQWTVDFFGIQPGDSFKVVYDEKMVDGQSAGIGRIWGAEFVHGSKQYYAIPFSQDGKLRYWEANGESLRKQFLKAPLKYTRISSKFSKARLHPVYKVYRPHHGVDYAAPAGTPVHSVADGTVTFRGWDKGGGGNTIKIKHAGGMETGYLHLKSFAKGISVGTRVSQGQLIGYVGSTGASTGPHLDFRIKKNGTPIDPLKLPQEPAEPISAANMSTFEAVRDRVIAELDGKEIVGGAITEQDIFPTSKSE